MGRIVHTGQCQQFLRNAHQPVRLSPDVLYKIADGLRVHVGILGNRVSQQLDGGQRRLQLVRGVGDKTAAHRIRFLQPFRHVVECRGQHSQLVPAGHFHPGGVLALPQFTDARCQPTDGARHGAGEEHADEQCHRQQKQRYAHQVLLKTGDDRTLLAVVFI